tara:strand:+ start:988 stop:1536 length:549 start_codon:yes stop_codon:yes gene_type:complete
MATARMTQNSLIMNNLMSFYNTDGNLEKILSIINGDSTISLRIVDWFATNYSKQYCVTYKTDNSDRFKVYVDYKLKLRSYSKKRFDPFCRWERISIPYKEDTHIQTTIGQLNFFKWALENDVIKYIQENYDKIEADMNSRNSTSKRRNTPVGNKTRKKREELSVSASKSIYREDVKIVVTFD